jgi:hypothetical protein
VWLNLTFISKYGKPKYRVNSSWTGLLTQLVKKFTFYVHVDKSALVDGEVD